MIPMLASQLKQETDWRVIHCEILMDQSHTDTDEAFGHILIVSKHGVSICFGFTSYTNKEIEMHEIRILNADNIEKANKYIDSNDNYTKPSDKKQMQIYINALLALSYSYASLPTEANNVINKIKKTIDIQNANEATAIPQLIAKSYEIQEKYCEAIPYRKQALD